MSKMLINDFKLKKVILLGLLTEKVGENSTKSTIGQNFYLKKRVSAIGCKRNGRKLPGQ